MVRLFRESAEEERIRDNLYALSMTMVIWDHLASVVGTMLSGIPLWLGLMATAEDCMTVWVVILGYHESRKRAPGNGWGGKILHYGKQDIVVLLLWILMRYITPFLLMPLWNLCVLGEVSVSTVKQELFTDLQKFLAGEPNTLPTMDNTCGGSTYASGFSVRPIYWSWQIVDVLGPAKAGPDMGGPWTPAWFMLWLVFAKLQVMRLFCLDLYIPMYIRAHSHPHPRSLSIHRP